MAKSLDIQPGEVVLDPMCHWDVSGEKGEKPQVVWEGGVG